MSKKVLKQVMNYILVVLGTFLLSFGAVIFLTECELVSGGISGIYRARKKTECQEPGPVPCGLYHLHHMPYI